MEIAVKFVPTTVHPVSAIISVLHVQMGILIYKVEICWEIHTPLRVIHNC